MGEIANEFVKLLEQIKVDNPVESSLSTDVLGARALVKGLLKVTVEAGPMTWYQISGVMLARAFAQPTPATLAVTVASTLTSEFTIGMALKDLVTDCIVPSS